MVQSITPEMVRNLDLPTDEGVIVAAVANSSPAAIADLQHGDIILKIGDRPLKDAPEFSRIMGELPVGKEVTLIIQRKKERLIKQVMLQESQNADDYRKTIKTTKIDLKDHFECSAFDFGITSLTWQFKQRVLAEGVHLDGVMISDVQEGGWAEKHGLFVGDVILEVNGNSITNLQEFKTAYNRALLSKKPVLFFINKGGARIYIAMDKKPPS